MTNFGFLQIEWPPLFADAQKAETLVIPDPRTACFFARRTLEQIVAWLYKSDPSLKLPYQDNLSALIHEPTFKNAVGAKIFVKAKLIKCLGNLAAACELYARAVEADHTAPRYRRRFTARWSRLAEKHLAKLAR